MEFCKAAVAPGGEAGLPSALRLGLGNQLGLISSSGPSIVTGYVARYRQPCDYSKTDYDPVWIELPQVTKYSPNTC